MPIRLRLTVAFAIAMAAVLALAGTFVYVRVSSDLKSSIDDSLRTRVDDLARQLQSTGPGGIGLGGPRAEGAEDILSEVLGPGGRVIASSEALSPASVLSSSQLAQAREQLTYFDATRIPGIEGQARLLARPVETNRGTLVAVTGASTGDRAETLSGLVTTFAIGGPLALLLASALGYGLGAFAMRPVEAMRAKAGRITLERSGQRLPLPAANDEIGRLGATLNEMLARIEGFIDRERSFVADAGHELRTPLAILRSELELGMRPDRTAEERRGAMRSAIEETDRLQRLADDLLALARSDQSLLSLQRRETAVAQLLEVTRLRFTARARAEGRSVVASAADGLTWGLDPERMESALGNLLDNALRHGSGTIRLDASSTEDELVIAVSDEGPGLPPDFAGRAFERFARAESGRTTSGTGLGLAIVRAIVEAHGGSVSVGAGAGARVELTIPRWNDLSTE